ncbi:hypothetical protein ACP3PM_17895 [Pseudomonas iridis]
MPWYKTGTVSITQNSNAVIGAGTAFIANSRVGDGFRGPDGRWYEVTNIASNTALSISPNYEGPTMAGGFYSIMPVQGYQKDLADQVRAILNDYGDQLAALGTTGNYDILPVEKGGTGAESESDARMALTAAKSGANSDITELNSLTKPLTAAQGGLAAGFIEGLYLTWVSATSISLGTGAAYSPNTGRILQVLTPITISGLSLAASTWYYVYLYENAGSPAVEVVATVPAAPYNGTARMKTGDSNRRYLGAIKTNASGQIFQFQHDSTGFIYWLSATNTAPFRVLNGGVQTIPTAFSLSPAVPPVSFTALINVSPSTTPALIYHASALGQLIQQQTATAVLGGIAFPLDSSQRIGYAVLSGGSVRIDVCGFLNER